MAVFLTRQRGLIRLCTIESNQRKLSRQSRLALSSRLTAEVSEPSILMNYAFWRRVSRLSLLCLALMLGLSACLGLDTTPSAQPTIAINQNPLSLSPTPTAPPYLVGAYVNNNTFPSSSGRLIVYVIFHHGQLPQAGGQASLYFHFEDGGGIDELNNQAGGRTTGSDGFATFFIGFSGLPANMPISIDVTVQFHGISNITEKDAASFSVVNSAPSATPSAPNAGG